MSAIEEQLNKDFNASIAQVFTRLVSALRLCNQKSLEMVAQQCMDGENLELRYDRSASALPNVVRFLSVFRKVVVRYLIWLRIKCLYFSSHLKL